MSQAKSQDPHQLTHEEDMVVSYYKYDKGKCNYFLLT